MNKLKKFYLIGLISLFFIIAMGAYHYVNAADITYKAEYESSTSYKLTITGLEEENEEYIYNAMICQEQDVTESDFLSSTGKSFPISYDDNTKTWEGSTLTAFEEANKLYGAFEKAGQYYVYVAKMKKGSLNYEIIDGPTEIETPPLPPLGHRITINPLYDGTDYNIRVNARSTMFHNNVQRKIRFYVGEVTDENLLKKLSEDKESAYEDLLEYAKKQEPNLKEDSFYDTTTSSLDYNIVADYPIENGKYYFIHSILDNENGTYNDVEDIEIYNGVRSDQGVNLDVFNYLGGQEDPNGNTVGNGNTTNKDNTIATKPLPKAGSSIVTMVILIVTIACVIALYVKNKKYKDIK